MLELVPAEPSQIVEILDATHAIWHDGLNRAAYAQYWAAQCATPWGRAHLDRWALVQDGHPVASTKLYRFDASLEGRDIRVLGLGAVFTHPQHRGHGYARLLIERVLDQGAADGFDLALLFSEIGAPYYERRGFTVVRTSDVEIQVVESGRGGAPAVLVRAGEDRDLPDIAANDRVRAAPYRFHLHRDRDLVQYAIARRRLLAGLGPPGAREVQFFVAEEGASAVAHIVIAVHEGRWTISEVGDRDPAGARVGAILQVLVARDPAGTRPTIRGWLPRDFAPPQLRIVSRERSADVMMIRPLSAKGTPASPLDEEDVLVWRSDWF